MNSLFVSSFRTTKDCHIEEFIALIFDYASACDAYAKAVKRRPGKLITLRQKARVNKKGR
jgi:hypothetical protein